MEVPIVFSVFSPQTRRFIMALPKRAFEQDFVPPPSLTDDVGRKRSKGPRGVLPVDKEIARSFSRMMLMGPKSTRAPFVPTAEVVDPELLAAALEHPETLDDLPDEEVDIHPFSLENTGEIRISALRGDSRETPFATQDLDVADEDELPGFFPEAGFQVFNSVHDLEERDRKFLDSDRMRVERCCRRNGIPLSDGDEDN